MATALTTLNPTQWRILNRLRDLAIPGYGAGDSGENLFNRYGADIDALTDLERRRLITTTLNNEPVILADQVRVRGWIAMQYATFRLTSAGTRAVTGPENCVLVVLANHGGPLHAWPAKRSAGADDDTLQALGAAGLIEPGGDRPLPLEAFKRIPDTLPLRITSKGRQYVAR